jgi:hypothetical protein
MYRQGKQNSRFLLSPEHLPPETGVGAVAIAQLTIVTIYRAFFQTNSFRQAILRGRIGVFAGTFSRECAKLFILCLLLNG